jgi:broad specificity phosphatase PhoE
MQRRVVAELERIIAAYPDPEPPPAPSEPPPTDAPKVEPPPMPVIAVVAHNSVVQAALAHFLGMPFENYERLGASPASVSTVMVTPKRTVVMAVNQTAQA